MNYDDPKQGPWVRVPARQYDEYKSCLSEKLALLKADGDILFGSQLDDAVKLVLADHPEWARPD